MSECQQFEQCREHFESVHRKLDQLDQAVRGNGRPGIQLRLDRLEQNAARQARLTWLIVAAVIATTTSGLIALLASVAGG
ncbi:hypothetical protein [Mucisphaera calidilacus]|uniref:Uncharacterized protein n=1 Tax=Mucisphaera calidilacus TaxID=2527982 RepID=A0A518BVM7_9BACT|nr:hypothetical protein [Mucisphaera calidilacus]QDU71043.1 hypothetical protein Pan265_08880 [Mucisphaera calidilacus]